MNTNDTSSSVTNHVSPCLSAAPAAPSVDRRTRIRGFALGIVATLAAGVAVSAMSVQAGHPGDLDTTFVPITPCRLFDTRPAPMNVGPRQQPLGPDETMVQRVRGSNGDCVIPDEAVAVALNATALLATAPSHATFFPADAALPNSSNLNFVPGMPPAPNKVDVKLSADGRVAIHNAFGQVDLLADVAGYYVPSGRAQLQAQIDNLYDMVQGGGTSRNTGETSQEYVFPKVSAGSTIVMSKTFPASGSPREGTISWELNVGSSVEGNRVSCGLAFDEPTLDAAHARPWDASANQAWHALSGTRAITIEPGAARTVHLVCDNEGLGVMMMTYASLVHDVSNVAAPHAQVASD